MDKSKIDSLLIPRNATLKQAMRRLNESGQGILFVTDRKKVLAGTITDGDIRRGLIYGRGFSDSVDRIMQKKFVKLYEEEPEKIERAKGLMRAKEIEWIPVLNDAGLVVDVIGLTDVFERRKSIGGRKPLKNHVVIMAGGKGSRLDPFTRILPKALIPIDEKPIIEIIMESFGHYGFERFIFTLNYKKEYIKMFLKENNFPYRIDWVEESDFLGTAGSLALLKDKVKETFVVSNCDIILNADYANILKWHKENKNIMTLIGCHKEIEIPYGILEMKRGKLSRIIEKPNYDVLINTGVYVLEPQVMSFIPEKKPINMDELIRIASRKGRVSVYPVHTGWFDIGQWEEYKKTFHELGGLK